MILSRNSLFLLNDDYFLFICRQLQMNENWQGLMESEYIKLCIMLYIKP